MVAIYLIYFSRITSDAPETDITTEVPENYQPLEAIGMQLKFLNESLMGKFYSETCPGYFRGIHEDLRPWKRAGISRDMIERAKRSADFRLVILKGKVCVEKLENAFQTRDTFTIWGILQLLKLFPDRVPDLELMFSYADRPKVNETHRATSPPVMFQYCKKEGAAGVLLPDWSFWGWAEINIKPWTSLMESLREGNKRIEWKDREPRAYWKGNPHVNFIRPKLMKCDVSKEHDWNARLYKMNWANETKEGFKNSKLENQCTHRYKIYVEGAGWSVSEKYILACDSMTLMIKPEFYDFFTRSMVLMQHFWHIRPQNMCTDIKLAVEWGNNHTHKAEGIGKSGSGFAQGNLKMEYVYDYMIHVFNEYAKLMKFKPSIPKGVVDIDPERMVSSRMEHGTSS